MYCPHKFATFGPKCNKIMLFNSLFQKNKLRSVFFFVKMRTSAQNSINFDYTCENMSKDIDLESKSSWNLENGGIIFR